MSSLLGMALEFCQWPSNHPWSPWYPRFIHTIAFINDAQVFSTSKSGQTLTHFGFESWHLWLLHNTRKIIHQELKEGGGYSNIYWHLGRKSGQCAYAVSISLCTTFSFQECLKSICKGLTQNITCSKLAIETLEQGAYVQS